MGNDVSAVEDYVYLADGSLSLIDVSNPEEPQLLDKFNIIERYFHSVFTHGEYIYIISSPTIVVLKNTLTDFEEESNPVRANYFMQNYPNPFNQVTTIQYNVPARSEVMLEVFNLMGQHVETLYNGKQAIGQYSINWDASGFSSGVYFYKLTTGDKSFSKRMVLLK
jgi:hypothetical protein